MKTISQINGNRQGASAIEGSSMKDPEISSEDPMLVLTHLLCLQSQGLGLSSSDHISHYIMHTLINIVIR